MRHNHLNEDGNVSCPLKNSIRNMRKIIRQGGCEASACLGPLPELEDVGLLWQVSVLLCSHIKVSLTLLICVRTDDS